MPQKRNKAADFGDILAALDQSAAGQAPAPPRPARRAERETELGPEHEPRRKNPLRRLLGNISLPWPSGISGLFGGFGPRRPAPYAEEAAEAKGAPPAEPVAGEAAKSEAAETGPPKPEPRRRKTKRLRRN